ncbi:mitochondrial cardiolipin hydrolase-like [Epargyreus clarus]|uniref:mitochondrial cardiolipin hydrolase-like n=1 Tax=Epargyreus clarus TaxID=520877 RepID=UPI003C2B2FBC
MRLSPRILSSVGAIAITCFVSAAAYYYKSRTREVNEVMVFCKLQYNAYNYFDKLVSFIEAAKHTVHVCMPGIHNPAIQGRLVKLIKEKDIKIRIIIDKSGYNESTDFFVRELIEAGAEIKFKANEPIFTMQHKFCLVDDRILMTGTLNWGNDRSCDHWNYVYITSKHQLVDPVKKEFYQMWEVSTDVQSTIHEQSTQILYDSDVETIEILNPEEVMDISAADNPTLVETEPASELQVMEA